ncbi:hypothetical protein DCCM_2710 [Desulfocucumis palustris]|uniref:Uncharacterized protein n=1 Tax=Desulfocucumis palustris TaxID=1898651 RepID=A0A2L2XC80_9FIRM|nr:hypothetical protein DCCM_2710 [Desulfocucumis palustris]
MSLGFQRGFFVLKARLSPAFKGWCLTGRWRDKPGFYITGRGKFLPLPVFF